MKDWFRFNKKIRRFPWKKAAQLLAEKAQSEEINFLLVRYETLRTEAQRQLPHGPGLLNRLDILRPLLEQQRNEYPLQRSF